jgi:MFS family permease
MSNLPPSAEPTTDAAGRKIWKVGTLTYTAGGLVALFLLMLWGDFANAMKDRSVSPVFQTLLHMFGASNFLLGLISSSVGAGISMILSPIIAYKSDRHRGRWGRRIPFILLSTPFVSLSMVGLGFSPTIGKAIHDALGPNAPSVNACTLSTLGFFWVIYDIASIVGAAVFGGLVNDVVPRSVLGRFFGLWRAVSLLAGVVFNTYLMNGAKQHYLEIYVGMALLFGFGWGFMCLRLKEGEYPSPPPPGPHGALGFFYAARGYFIECFSIPYYWLYFGAAIFGLLSAVPINSYSVPFADTLGLSNHYGDYLRNTFIVSLVLAYPLGALVDRVHPLPLGLTVMVMYMLVVFWGGFYAADPHMFGTVLIAHGVLNGTYATVTASLGQRLLPRASFAQFASAQGILQAICLIIIPPGIGKILDIWKDSYQYTFFISAGFSAIACVLLFALYLQFLKRGGPTGYVAPDRPPA